MNTFAVAAAIYEYFEGGPVHWVWTAPVVSVVVGLPCVLQLIEQRRDIRFRRWILEHWNEIQQGRAVLDGVPVGPETEFVRYRVVLSLLFVLSSGPSRPVLPGTTAASRTRWSSTATTALAGWWFLPSGPFRTIGALRANLSNRPVRLQMADIANATMQARPLSQLEFEA